MFTVFSLALIELWAAIPAGLALDLHPLVAGTISALGAIAGVILISVLGERARTWILRFRGAEGTRHGRIHRIWNRYGVIGLGLLSPLLFGAPLGTAIGITLGARTGRLILWMSMGIVLWSIILTIAATLGLTGVQWFIHQFQ